MKRVQVIIEGTQVKIEFFNCTGNECMALADKIIAQLRANGVLLETKNIQLKPEAFIRQQDKTVLTIG